MMKSFIVLNVFLVVLVINTCYDGCVADHHPTHTTQQENDTKATDVVESQTHIDTNRIGRNKAVRNQTSKNHAVRNHKNKNHTGRNHTAKGRTDKHGTSKTSCKKILTALLSTMKQVREVKGVVIQQSNIIRNMHAMIKNLIGKGKNHHVKGQHGKHQNRNQTHDRAGKFGKGQHEKHQNRNKTNDWNGKYGKGLNGKDNMKNKRPAHGVNGKNHINREKPTRDDKVKHGKRHLNKKQQVNGYNENKKHGNNRKHNTNPAQRKGKRMNNKKYHMIETCGTENITLNCSTGYIHVMKVHFGYGKNQKCSLPYGEKKEEEEAHQKQCQPLKWDHDLLKKCTGKQDCTICNKTMMKGIKENMCKIPTYTKTVYCCKEKDN